MIQLMKVTGESLSPFYLDGDYAVILKIPFFLRRLKPGDFIVFSHPVYGRLIKQVGRVIPEDDELFVSGSHPESTDSRSFGAIPRKWVTGKVIGHFRKPSSS